MQSRESRRRAVPFALATALALAGCIGETLHRGYIVPDMALQQVQPGAPREQVLIALGTPSTIADFDGEVFYYISQVTNRPVAFMSNRVIDQQVLAIYFGQDSQVEEIRRYGLEDGRIIDLVSRITPTGGKDFFFLSQIFSVAGVGGTLGRRPVSRNRDEEDD
jgi:outer membrane protein assembly factor BamE (lipoprotein component of BamABCDE complex)